MLKSHATIYSLSLIHIFALDLGDQPEGETQHLAVDRVVERVALFGRVEIDLLLEAFTHDRHNVGERSAQTRDLGDDQRIRCV